MKTVVLDASRFAAILILGAAALPATADERTPVAQQVSQQDAGGEQSGRAAGRSAITIKTKSSPPVAPPIGVNQPGVNAAKNFDSGAQERGSAVPACDGASRDAAMKVESGMPQRTPRQTQAASFGECVGAPQAEAGEAAGNRDSSRSNVATVAPAPEAHGDHAIDAAGRAMPAP